jgi:hypothetical protein
VASLLIRPTSGDLFEIVIMLLVGLLDAIDAVSESFSIVPNEIYRLQRLCASRCALSGGIYGGSFFSHPDESNNVKQVIAMNAKPRAVFIGLTKKP